MNNRLYTDDKSKENLLYQKHFRIFYFQNDGEQISDTFKILNQRVIEKFKELENIKSLPKSKTIKFGKINTVSTNCDIVTQMISIKTVFC